MTPQDPSSSAGGDLPQRAPARLEFERFSIDVLRGVAYRNGAELRLRPQTFEVLSFLARNAGRLVTKEEMFRNVWDGIAVTDDSLVQCIRELRQALGDSSQTLIRTLPRRGYVLTGTPAAAPSPPPAAPRSEPPLQTKAGEAATEGMPPARRPSPRSVSGRAIGIALVAATLLALVASAFVTRRPAHLSPPTTTLAVLPFVSLGPSADADEYLGLGMADALIARLSGLPRLVVKPTSAIAGTVGLPAQEAGRKLGVDYVLEGHTQRLGSQLRVTSQMISVADGSTLWNGRFDIEEPNVFRIEDSIAERAALSLLESLSSNDRKALLRRDTTNHEARVAYQKGRLFWARLTEQGLRAGIEQFQRAVSLDPAYALAYAGLADAYAQLAIYGPVDPRVQFQRAKTTALKALELDPDLAEAHASLAFVAAQYDHDWKSAEAGYRRALELSPAYATALQWLALAYMAQGRVEDAVSVGRRAVTADPLSPLVNTDFGRILYYAGRYDEAIEELRNAVELDPGLFRSHLELGRAYRQKGMHDLAIAELTRAASISKRSSGALAELAGSHADAGDPGQARKYLSELESRGHCAYTSPYHFAVIYASLGDRERAMRALEAAFEQRFSGVVFAGVEPEFGAMRADPRFGVLAHRLGLDGERAQPVVLGGSTRARAAADP